MTKKQDLYGYRAGIAFAREMVMSVTGNLSVEPVLENLRRALGNKPPAMAEGIRYVIDLIEKARDSKLKGVTK